MTDDDETKHLSLPYKEVTDPGFAEHVARTFSLASHAPEIRTLHGDCPRCKGFMAAPVVDGVVKGTRPLGDQQDGSEEATPDDYDTEPMICLCDADLHLHPGRPEGRIGCGAYWILMIAKER